MQARIYTIFTSILNPTNLVEIFYSVLLFTLFVFFSLAQRCLSDYYYYYYGLILVSLYLVSC